MELEVETSFIMIAESLYPAVPPSLLVLEEFFSSVSGKMAEEENQSPEETEFYYDMARRTLIKNTLITKVLLQVHISLSLSTGM